MFDFHAAVHIHVHTTVHVCIALLGFHTPAALLHVHQASLFGLFLVSEVRERRTAVIND